MLMFMLKLEHDVVLANGRLKTLKQILMQPITYFYRSSHWRRSLKKCVLKNFTKFTGKHLCWRPATLLKKRLRHRCFTVNFV